jgi:hypothetical protein
MESSKTPVLVEKSATGLGPPKQKGTGASSHPTDATNKPGIANPVLMPRPDRFIQDFATQVDVRLDQHDKAYIVGHDAGNLRAIYLSSRECASQLRDLGIQSGLKARNGDIAEWREYLQAHAEKLNRVTQVWQRVAKIDGGIEIDLGDDKYTRVRITAAKVEIVANGSKTLFYRPPTSRPMAMPAEVGNLTLLDKYLNFHPQSLMLFIAYLTYTLATPKRPSAKFLILVIHGPQGIGKSMASKIAIRLIDPSVIDVQVMPDNKVDLTIAAQNAHVLCYDNLREFRHWLADLLCIASTGGSISTRQLYSDAKQQVHQLHVALILNGIHAFIDQPDLAQRTLTLNMQSFDESSRKSEADMLHEFELELPAIQRGLFDLISTILLHLPTAEVTNPERMIDFVRWLAGYEKACGLAPGIFQAAYSEALCLGQRDSLLDNLLGTMLLEFAEKHIDCSWSGTPTQLLDALNNIVTLREQRSRDWPQTVISLSKRLSPLQAPLLSQGIRVELPRAKHRMITITKDTVSLTPMVSAKQAPADTPKDSNTVSADDWPDFKPYAF